MNKVVNLSSSPRIHSLYKNPQLMWSGDINNDGKPDFLLKHKTMKDTCGLGSYIFLVISQVGNGTTDYYQSTTGIDPQKIK